MVLPWPPWPPWPSHVLLTWDLLTGQLRDVCVPSSIPHLPFLVSMFHLVPSTSACVLQTLPSPLLSCLSFYSSFHSLPFLSPSYPDGIISTTAYASTYQTNAGEIHMYQELDNLAVSHPPHTPHFALHMGTGHDSVHSVSGDAARPSLPPHFISSPTLWTASSMHPGSADPVGSLRQAASLLPHLPVTSMPVVPGSSHPRGSSPVWCQQKTQQPLLPKASSFHQPTGKSSPSPSPPLCSPSPHGVGNTAAPYSLPVPKPWYKSDYEPATVAGVVSLVTACMCVTTHFGSNKE